MKIIIVPNNTAMWGRHYCIAKTLEEQGHEIHYMRWELPYNITFKELLRHLVTSLIPRHYKFENFTIHKVSRLPYFWPVVNGWLFKYQAKKLFKKLDADIIFSESFTNETEIPKGLPFIYDLADDYAAPAEVYGSRVYKLAFKVLGIKKIMRRQSQNALAVTAVSPTLYDYARQYNDRSYLVPNGVDSEIIKEVKEDKSTRSKNKHSMVYVTGFGQWSRPIETLQAVVDLRKEFPALELTLVGEGPEEHNIRTFIAEQQAGEYIHFLGVIRDRKKLFETINRHAIGINISDKNKWRDAAHPIKVLEYSAMAKKVVSTNLKGVVALKYKNIVTFSDKSKGNVLKSALRKALKAKVNTKDYNAISKRVLDEYDWTMLTQKLTDIIDVAKKDAGRPPVTHVTSSYPPNLGGLERVVQNLARTQSETGLQASVLTSRARVRISNSDTDDFTVTRLRSRLIANTTIMPGLFPRLLRLSRESIVHLHVVQAFAPEMVWLASKIKGFRYIAHIHLDVTPTGPAGFLLKFYKPLVLKRVLRSASYVIVFTEDQKAEMHRKYGLASEKIMVIPNGVEDRFYNNASKKLHKKPRLLFVGRLDAQKNLQLLFRALNGISDKFETTIVGTGYLESELKMLVKELKLKNVKFVGRKDGTPLLNYYKRSDVFVLPSEQEGMPLVLLEAMAMGLPAVATNVTGTRDVIEDGMNGYLATLDDVEEFRAALLKIGGDAKQYQKLSASARKLAERHTWPTISERFVMLYEQIVQVARRHARPAEGVALWNVVLPLLVIANTAYLLRNAFGAAITLGFFLFVPGYLLFKSLKTGITSRWETAGFSLGLSLLLFMVGGLALNSLHAFGLERPLSTANIFTVLDGVSLALLLVTRHIRITRPTLRFHASWQQVTVAALLTLLPLLAAGGAIRLNNGASNVLTMVMFLLIPLLLLVLVMRKDLRVLYPYALFTAGLAVLLSNSMRGLYITGHDIHHEFAVFQNTSARELWYAHTPQGDPYNACLSITILPTIMAKITAVSASYIYKLVYQILFAFSLGIVYAFVKRISSRTKALVAGFLFITFPTFIDDMSFINRQEIAFVFFSLLLLTMFIKMAQRTRTILLGLLIAGLVLSHYSSSYVALGLLLLAWVARRIFFHTKAANYRLDIPLVGLPLLVAGGLLVYVWNVQITASTAGLQHTISETISSTLHHKSTHDGFVKYSILGPIPQSPLEELQAYIGTSPVDAKYVQSAVLPETGLGKAVSHVVNVQRLNSVVHGVIAKFFQIILLLGVVYLFFKQRKAPAPYERSLFLLTAVSVLMLVLITVLPQLSVDYSVIRLFQQTLVITALPIILGLEFVLKKFGRFAPVGVTVIVALLFLNLTGFVPQQLGGNLPQLSLNNAGTYYDFFYTHEEDMLGTQWLADNKLNGKPARVDVNSASPLLTYPIQTGLVKVDTRTGYLYEDYTNVTKGVYRVFVNGDLIEYADPNLAARRDVIYVSQGARVYGNYAY